MKKVILASKSPRRIEYLKLLVDDFDIEPSGYDEVMTDGEPGPLVEKLATGKALDVAASHKGEQALVIGADTVVAVDKHILGKPADEEEAFLMIKSFQGRNHVVSTGVCIIDTSTEKQYSFFEETVVKVASMTDEEIRQYISKNESLDKAGAYAIQGFFSPYITGIEGDYCNVVGLPVSRLYQALKKLL